MKMNSNFKWIFIGVLCLSQSLFSWDGKESEAEGFVEELWETYRNEPIKISHTEANGIGYNCGYTTLETFLTLPNAGLRCWIPFIDTRTHLFNDGQYASNTGGGVRYVSSSRVWGANILWDYRGTRHHDYNQVGIGLESLGCVWDYRLNVYLPIGTQSKNESRLRFEDDTVTYSVHQEFAMKGVNAEIGAEVGDFFDFELYAAIGPYYFRNFGKHAFGGMSRLKLRCSEYVHLEVIGSYDNIFHSVVQGRIDLRIPFGCHQKLQENTECSYEENLVLRKKAVHRLERFNMIVVDRKTL